MNKISIKSVSILSIWLAFAPSHSLSQVRICEIKYGQPELIKPQSVPKVIHLLNNRPNCYQIGMEYNESGEPIAEKPIIACCRSDN